MITLIISCIKHKANFCYLTFLFQAKKIEAEEHQARHQTSEAANNYLNSLNDEDVLNEETLMKLWQSPDIQLALKNKEIVDGLMALNSSMKPDKDFLKFANVPQYGYFIDKCLETIEHIKSETGINI